MNTIVVALAITSVALLIWFGRNGGQLPPAFHTRSCQGKGWRKAFPNASKQDIRAFLSLFIEAFAFRRGEGLKFNPSDEILAVYRALYPRTWTPDALELETFAKAVEKTYGINFGNVWNEHLTLGQLFAYVYGPSRVPK